MIEHSRKTGPLAKFLGYRPVNVESDQRYAGHGPHHVMSWTARLAVSGLVALWLSLTLTACGERSNEKITAAPTVELVGPSDTPEVPAKACRRAWNLTA